MVQGSGADHETRLRSIERDLPAVRSDVAEVRTDVRWLRELFDRPKTAGAPRLQEPAAAAGP